MTEQDRRRFGYMPEERGLYPGMPILDQLEYLGRLHDMTATSARGAAQDWIKRLGLAGRESAKLEALSHGNQQRVQLAAALMHDPELLVLDEPFVSLDAELATRLRAELAELVARRPVTTLLVSHDVDEVIGLADRVFLLSDSPARVLADMPIQNPRSARSADDVAAIRNALSRKAGAARA